MSKANPNRAAKPAAKSAAKPNTPATAQTGNIAEVPAAGASQEAPPAAVLPHLSKTTSGDMDSSPLEGKDAGLGVIDDQPDTTAKAWSDTIQDDHDRAFAVARTLEVHAITVVSETEGFRRAGRAWSRTPITVPLSEFSDADILLLESEPKLTVAYLADSAEKTAD